MKYAVLSDIHGNLEALSAVMERLNAERIDRYLCLGDVVGYGADPAACLERLEACGAVTVGGNHDVACVGKLGLDWFHDTARAALEWTREQLSFAELDGLRRLPLTATEGPLTLVHGTLTHPERFEYLVDFAQAVEMLERCRTLMCLLGHTHVPLFIEYDRPQRRIVRVLTVAEELRDVAVQGDPATRRYLVNPGSVGQPRDGDPRASVAIIDTDQRRVAVERVPYDVAAAQRKIRQAGLPAFLADRLAIGR
ncbi:MAG: metallophosphoesterase family protein [Candidatus Omnitrophota bacterium]|nr:metallophosphoesterase family protein [Candidatus Omnitrophota bacterium]